MKRQTKKYKCDKDKVKFVHSSLYLDKVGFFSFSFFVKLYLKREVLS